jgi:hypothetical protein
VKKLSLGKSFASVAWNRILAEALSLSIQQIVSQNVLLEKTTAVGMSQEVRNRREPTGPGRRRLAR